MVRYSTVTPGLLQDAADRGCAAGATSTPSELRDGVRLGDRQPGSWPRSSGRARIRSASSFARRRRDEAARGSRSSGVVGDVRQERLARAAAAADLFPARAPARRSRAARVQLRRPRARTSHAQADAVRRAVWALDRDLPVAAMRTMDEMVERSVVQFSFTMLTLAIAAGIALCSARSASTACCRMRSACAPARLACAWRSARRRCARDARRWWRTARRIAGVGLVVGSLGAAGLTRFLGGLLYETKPLDLADIRRHVRPAARGRAARRRICRRARPPASARSKR